MENITSATVTIMISNMDAAIRFYTEILGLKIKNRYGDHYAEIDAQGLIIGLHPAKEGVVYGNNMSIGFGTKTFDETVKEYSDKGVRLTVKNDGWSRLALFTDPDKNELYLAELK